MSWIYLSHVLSETTPLYGGNGEIHIGCGRAMSLGHSSNNSELAFPAHAGTHVDAPRHFDPQGMTLDQYPADYWFARKPVLLDIPTNFGEILNMQRLGVMLETIPEDCDLLLLRTGAEAWRTDDSRAYAEKGPGIAPDLADWLRSHRRLKFLGIDFISVSSFTQRQLGREAHRALLAPHESGATPILPIEDMSLSALVATPVEVAIAPMLFSSADGAPVTVLARQASEFPRKAD